MPLKIKEGRPEDIRECIGCNICYTGDQTGTPIRCTQNPTMGEEWRRGWHPERIAPKGSDSSVLVVGAGPAGLEAAVALGRRGYAVTLAEARTELGGRSALESALPGLAEWARVRDWRIAQLNQLSNVEVYLDSQLDAEQICEFGADRVALATGALWRRDGTGRSHVAPVAGWERPNVLTPDDVMAGVTAPGPVLVFDDEHYYMGGVIAEKLRHEGRDVTLVTTGPMVSTWTTHTDEQEQIQTRVLELGIEVLVSTTLTEVRENSAELACVYTGRSRSVEIGSVVMVTSREPSNALFSELAERIEMVLIGDCLAPSTIAAAVHSGHLYAREMDTTPQPFKREHGMAPRS